MTETMAQRIQRVRKLEGYSQMGLAVALGVTLATVQRWEAGKYRPQAGQLAKLAIALNVTVDWLVTGE